VSLESGDFFPCQAFFLPLIKGDFLLCWTFSLSPQTFCPHGCFVPTIVLSLDVLSLRTFCPPRRFVPPDVFSAGLFVPLDVFSHGHLVTRRLVAGRFVAGRFVWVPAQQFLKPKPEQLFYQIV
jgi:hypothetical protein